MEASLLLITGILNIVLGGYALYRNPKKILNVSLALFALGAAGWILSLWFTIYFAAYLPISKITFISPMFIVAFLALFSYELDPKIFKKELYIPFLILLPPSIFVVLVFLNKVVTSVGVKNNHIVNTYGEAYPLYGILVLVYIFGSLFFLIYKYFKSKGIDSLRLKYVLWGLALMLIPSVTTNLILPLVFRMQGFNTLGPASSTFMVIAMSYAILRYHLLDIWVVIRLGTIFALLFGAISVLYIGVLSFLGRYLGGVASLLLTSLVIVITFEPLKRGIARLTDRVLFQKHYNVEQVIAELTSVVHRGELEIQKILRAFNAIVLENFKVQSVAMAVLAPGGSFLGMRRANSHEDGAFELRPNNPIVEFLSKNTNFIINKEELSREIDAGSIELPVERIELLPGVLQELARLDFAFAMPIVAQEKLIAIYFVGEKKSKDLFSQQDISLLDHLTSEVGAFIDNARIYEDLKTLDEAKSNFISVVSHQLRTPLSAMRWSMEMLLDGDVDKKLQKEFLDDTYHKSLFVISHLDDMLVALDIERGDVDCKREQCDIHDMTKEILDGHKGEIENNDLQVEVKISDEARHMVSDCKKISRALTILLHNAIQYAPSGGKVEVHSTARMRSGNKLIEVSIIDNGIGISAEEQRYIFQKFFRGEEAKRVSPNGFGLGLFIAKSFIEAHGGTIHFESAGRDKGTKFSFTIPTS